MSDLRKAAQSVMEALDGLSEDAVCQSSHHAKKDRHTSLDVCPVFLRVRAAITALRAALAEPVQEPVAWHYTWHCPNNGGGAVMHWGPSAKLDADIQAAKDYPHAHKLTPLYAAPPQREPMQDHEDWCASVTQLLMSYPPRKAPCNCKKRDLPGVSDEQ